MERVDCPSTVSVIGTGEFGRSIATRLHESSFDVVMGSRFPSRRTNVPKDDILSKVKITSIQSCMTASDVIIMAVRPEDHAYFKPLESLLVGKILVDCSNSRTKDEGHSKVSPLSQSNAQKLAALFPRSHVVKAFNTVSAYALLTMYHNRATYVCGDSQAARHVVMQMASRIGFLAFDSGRLASAALVEEYNHQVLPGWGWPTLVTCIVSVIWIVYTICRYYVMRETPYTWERLPTNVVNKMAGVISITLLALTYIPGSIAAFKQLANGTKHKRFHKSLDRWLRMRKQLGLYALLFGTMHTLMSMTLLSPAYYSDWFHSNSATIPGNLTEDLEIDTSSRMTWLGETCTLLGFLAQFAFAILGITSINSIANSLNWKEWQYLQSYMGLTCLLFSTAHTTTKGAASWVVETWKDILPSMAFLSCLLPWFAIGLRLILLMPCVYKRLNKIRRGWESGHYEHVAIEIDESLINGKVSPAGKVNAGFDNTTF